MTRVSDKYEVRHGHGRAWSWHGRGYMRDNFVTEEAARLAAQAFEVKWDATHCTGTCGDGNRCYQLRMRGSDRCHRHPNAMIDMSGMGDGRQAIPGDLK